jgi:hypothetical protein
MRLISSNVEETSQLVFLVHETRILIINSVINKVSLNKQNQT